MSEARSARPICSMPVTTARKSGTRLPRFHRREYEVLEPFLAKLIEDDPSSGWSNWDELFGAEEGVSALSLAVSLVQRKALPSRRAYDLIKELLPEDERPWVLLKDSLRVAAKLIADGKVDPENPCTRGAMFFRYWPSQIIYIVRGLGRESAMATVEELAAVSALAGFSIRFYENPAIIDAPYQDPRTCSVRNPRLKNFILDHPEVIDRITAHLDERGIDPEEQGVDELQELLDAPPPLSDGWL